MWQPTDGERFTPAVTTTATLLPKAFMDTEAVIGRRLPLSDAFRPAPSGSTRIVLFFVLTLVAMAVTDLMVDSGLQRITTSSFGVFNRMVTGQINANIVISGSSRAVNNVDPRVIQARTGLSTFNIGVNGSQTDMQLAVLKTYLKHNAKPSLVVHSLDSFSFVTSRSGVWFTAQYLPYLHEPDIYQALSAVNPHAWKAKYLPLYGYAVEDMNFTWLKGLGGMLGWTPREDRYLGFEPRAERWTEDFARFKARRPNGIQFDVEPEGVRVFEELMALCKKMDVPLLLVYSPVYYEMQALERNREEVFGRFRDIARRYQAPLWDYSQSSLSLQRDYFVNSEHLNADGATAFSAELSAALTRSGMVAVK